jgi:hypothetical protein
MSNHKIKLDSNILFVRDTKSSKQQPRDTIYYKGSELEINDVYYEILKPYGKIETKEEEIKVVKKKKKKEE